MDSFIFFEIILSYYPLIITATPQGITVPVILAYIQSSPELHCRLGLVADIVISCSVVCCRVK